MTPEARAKTEAVLARDNSEGMVRDLAAWYGVSVDEVRELSERSERDEHRTMDRPDS